MPMAAPTIHNPALVLNWCRSGTTPSSTCQDEAILHAVTPQVCHDEPALPAPLLDHFDLAGGAGFRFDQSTAALKTKSSEPPAKSTCFVAQEKTSARRMATTDRAMEHAAT
jgi:hypothetical protein